MLYYTHQKEGVEWYAELGKVCRRCNGHVGICYVALCGYLPALDLGCVWSYDFDFDFLVCRTI